MPRYFLHIRDRYGFALDDVGVETADLAAARRRAVDGARSLISDDVHSGVLDLRGSIDIADAAGSVLLTVPFTECVEFVDGALPSAMLPLHGSETTHLKLAGITCRLP